MAGFYRVFGNHFKSRRDTTPFAVEIERVAWWKSWSLCNISVDNRNVT